MLWPLRQDFLTEKTVTLGQPLSWEITREFPIDSIIIAARINTSTANTSWLTDAPWNLLKRITLNISDGARTRNVVDISGIGLIEYGRQVNGGLDHLQTKYRGGSTTYMTLGDATFLNYPIFCALPNVADPVSSTLCLPAPRYNANPVLTITPTAAITDLGATLAATVSIMPIVLRREVKDPKWTYYDWELNEQQFTMPTTGFNMMEMQVPGSYTMIGLRGYTSAGARTDPTFVTNAAAASIVFGETKLQVLNSVIRRFTWPQMFFQNSLSICTPWDGPLAPLADGPDAPATSVWMDFLSDRSGETVPDFGSVFDVNPLMATGARAQLVLQNGQANSYVQCVTHRIFGILDAAKPRVAA